MMVTGGSMVRLQFSFAGIYTADGKMQVHLYIYMSYSIDIS